MSQKLNRAAVPCKILAGGARMPAIGMGTFGSDHAAPGEIAQAVRGAFEAGYRHFDCAAVYGNEREIGRVFRDILRSGVPREELWITSKLWNDRHDQASVIPACRRSVEDLQVGYLDMYLVHWPFPNFHPPGCSVESRNPNAKPYIHAGFMATWREMEKLVDLGLTRHIGTSNMTVPKLRLLLRDARIRPAVNEMELHPHFQQPELFQFVLSHGIAPVAYCPLGSPHRPDRDRTPQDSVDMEDPVILRIAARHRCHPAQICLKWSAHRGAVPIPMSTKPEHYVANLDAVTSDPLTLTEMQEIERIDRNCRLIKGQVFLWKQGQSWEDLWDMSGEITPP